MGSGALLALFWMLLALLGGMGGIALVLGMKGVR